MPDDAKRIRPEVRPTKCAYFYRDTKRNEVLHISKHSFEIEFKNITIEKNPANAGLQISGQTRGQVL